MEVLSEGRLEILVGVFKAGKVGLAEVTSCEVGLGEVASCEVGLGEVTSHDVGMGEVTSALGEIAGDEVECILASNEVFTGDCGCQMNDTGRCLGDLTGEGYCGK